MYACMNVCVRTRTQDYYRSFPFSAAQTVHTLHALLLSDLDVKEDVHTHRPSHLDLCLILRQTPDRKHLSS